MVDSANIYREQQKACALELMEKALAILVVVDDSHADCYLQQAIDTCMESPRMEFPDDEIWDKVDELPHLTERALFLHRQNGFGVDQIAKRLGIEPKEAAERLSCGLNLVRAPASVAEH
ncbi:hypothetical protein [Sphingobium ummariense]|uniref:RNA polymerase sigma factor 70 region 4 type 2 domain-containing protein n=1 Tax=Sphingobium ummariense RL-3 TaxID=1346791 RepID=T0IXM2_9SPHN|nr:hypothetical protein [Sphingobium ummariense]EQB33530.1 hypothetical protein M529_03745 [Sphingobium ummariense RL-3]